MSDFFPFNPFNWHWQVAGRADYWSSAAGAYVDALPEGAGVTRIASEDELTGVLADYGLPGPTVRVPAAVSARQFKLQLLAAGLLERVETFVASQGATVQIAFDNSGSFVRAEPMMAAGFSAMGFSEEQIDAFFVAAGKL